MTNPTKTFNGEKKGYNLKAGTLIANRYKVLRLLGRGGFADVYAVEDTLLGVERACKYIHGKVDENRFRHIQREVNIGQKLQHPNLVTIYHLDMDGDHPFIIMELIDGKTLKEILEEEKHLTSAKVKAILRDILSALVYLHERDLIHRDIKPSNILVTKDGVVKIADFGLLKPTEGDTVTREGIFMGTPEYAAPELFKGEKAIKQSDLYALGITAYQLLTGTLPFQGSSAMGIGMKHLKEKLPPFPKGRKIPKSLRNFILHLTAKEPKRRPEDAQEALALLEAKHIPKPHKKSFIYTVSLIFLFLLTVVLYFYKNPGAPYGLKWQENGNDLAVCDKRGRIIAEKTFPGALKQALLFQADEDREKEAIIITDKDPIHKTKSTITLYDPPSSWHRLPYSIPEVFQNASPTFSAYAVLQPDPLSQKDLLLLNFHHTPYAPSFIAYYAHGKVYPFFSNSGHIDYRYLLVDINSDGIPDWVGNAYATGMAGCRAIFAVRGAIVKNDPSHPYLSFIAGASPDLKPERGIQAILFYTLIEPHNMDYTRLRVKGDTLYYLIDHRTGKEGKMDFYGNLESSPYYHTSQGLKGWEKKKQFYRKYDLVRQYIKKGSFQEALWVIQDLERQNKDILHEAPLYHILLPLKAQALTGIGKWHKARNMIDEELRKVAHGEIALKAEELAYASKDDRKGEAYAAINSVATVFGSNLWSTYYIKFLAHCIQGDDTSGQRDLAALKKPESLAPAFIISDLSGFLAFLNGSFEEALKKWETPGHHLSGVKAWRVRALLELGKDIEGLSEGRWRFMVLGGIEKDPKKLKETFNLCKKLAKVSLACKIQLPFMGYDTANALIRAGRRKEAKGILLEVQDLIPGSYIHKHIQAILPRLQ